MWINQGFLEAEASPKIVIARPTFSAGQQLYRTVFGAHQGSNFHPLERLFVAEYGPCNDNCELWENRGG